MHLPTRAELHRQNTAPVDLDPRVNAIVMEFGPNGHAAREIERLNTWITQTLPSK